MFTAARDSWVGGNVVSIDQFNREAIEFLVEEARRMKILVEEKGGSEALKGKVLANVFYEPSTRTSCSFHSAMLRLGGSVVPVSESSSSATKGESLEDTVRCLECYCDALVLRHPIKGSAKRAADVTSIPVLNAGDGVGEHPTQALLDFVTIASERGLEEKCEVTLLGDLKHGRTVHSLALLLTKFSDIFHTLNLVAPPGLGMPEEVVERVRHAGIVVNEGVELEEVVKRSGVLYVTRVQKERFPTPEDYDRVKDAYVVNKAIMELAPPHLILLHPLPRVAEIHTEVDTDPRAKYFQQMRYGLYTRMALLHLLIPHKKSHESGGSGE